MPLARSLREAVTKRAARNPEFRALTADEAERVLAEGDPEAARRLLRYLTISEPRQGHPADGTHWPKPSPSACGFSLSP